VYDHRRSFLGLFPDGLYYLSRERRRKIFGIHRVDRRNLLSDTGIARSACFCDPSSGDYDARSGFSPQMGSPQANRALDDPNLALRLSHRGVRVLNALQVVSARGVTSNLALDH
jgi:hypothetical protein